MSVEAGRCEIALPQITLDVCANATRMDQDGILSQVRGVQSKARHLGSQVVVLQVVQDDTALLTYH